MKTNPLIASDGYKTSHHKMYPQGTTKVVSNFTPRSVNYMPNLAKDIIVFGTQYTVKVIKELYDENFFSQPKHLVVGEAKKYLDSYLGVDYDVSHFEALHDLGYLPLEIRTLEEGSKIKAKIPILHIHNTIDEFYWLTNFLETLISTTLWKPMHSASMSYAYKKLGNKYALKTDKDNIAFTDFQFHDFSMRGMQSLDSAIASALGFLVCSKGTDTMPALQAAEHYYNSTDVAFSVPASEHAVMTAYGKENEIESFNRILDLYPKGIVSMVSDQYDLWRVLTEFLPKLKEKIMARDGKSVFRPDSGNPVDILCGLNSSIYGNTYGGENMDNSGISRYNSQENPVNFNGEKGVPPNHPSVKGVIEILWDIFGGTVNEQGFKVLDSHVGAIYGDSITLDRADEIMKRLQLKGFASTNVVFGAGSYSMGFSTRDSQGSAVKATYCEVNGEGREIFKDPVTDDGTKKSAKGLITVLKDSNGELYLKDQCSWEEVNSESNQLKVIFKDGKILKETTLEEIRERVKSL